MTPFISHKKFFICLLIVGLVANVLFVGAEGKRNKKRIGDDGASTTSKPGGASTTSKPDGASTTSKPDGSTTGKPVASMSTGKPGGSTTTGKPGGSVTTPSSLSSSSTGKPGSTSAPGKDTSTPPPKDKDKAVLEEMQKLQAEEKALLRQVNERMQAWVDWIEKHNSKSMNRHHLFDFHHKYCDRIVEVYKATPVKKRFSTVIGRPQAIRARGLHTITI